MTRSTGGMSAEEGARCVIEVYRAAQRQRADEFAKTAFAWLARHMKNDHAVIVTSLRGATWVDAHFDRIPDPRALMESHARVRHLDPLAPALLADPNVVHRQSYDSPEIAAARFAPFREHLRQYDGRWVLSIAVPNDQDKTLSVLMVIRGWSSAGDFSADEHAFFSAVAPHVVEAFAVNRTTFLGSAAGPKAGAAAPGDAPPIASIDTDGRFTGTTPAFVRIFWPVDPPETAYLSPDVVKRLRRGLPWPLPGGRHTLHAYEDESGGYLLRLRSTSPADQLSARERQIAAMFARGASYKAIATELALSPATVRNHLQNLYGKLGVTQRDELSALLSRP